MPNEPSRAAATHNRICNVLAYRGRISSRLHRRNLANTRSPEKRYIYSAGPDSLESEVTGCNSVYRSWLTPPKNTLRDIYHPRRMIHLCSLRALCCKRYALSSSEAWIKGILSPSNSYANTWVVPLKREWRQMSIKFKWSLSRLVWKCHRESFTGGSACMFVNKWMYVNWKLSVMQR